MLVDIQNGRPVGYITIDEYAEKYNVKEYTARAWERAGKLRTLKITSGGHTILFVPADEPLPYLNRTGVARKGREKVDKLPFSPSEYYTVREFAQKVGASPVTVWQWCHRGYLKYFKTDTNKGARLLIAKDTPIPEKCYYQKGVMK
jgi:predicted site-specific integrase-resolvase